MDDREINHSTRIADLIIRQMNGKLSTSENEEFQQWLSADEKNRRLFDELSDEQTLEQALRKFLAYDTKARLSGIKRKSPSRHTGVRWLRYAAAACIALLVGAGIIFFTQRTTNLHNQTINLTDDVSPGANRATLILSNGSRIDLDEASSGKLAEEAGMAISKTGDGQLTYKGNERADMQSMLYNEIHTPRGGQYTVTLPDGTKVWLNAASSLRYPVRFNDEMRLVELDGEGYFEVSHNKQQPFMVRAGGQTVEVLGTSFNIQSYENEPIQTTTLVSGSLRVSRNASGHTTILKPGQQSRLSDNGLEVMPVDTDESIAWKNGQFIFSNTDLTTIMRQIERWYDVEVDFSQLPEKRFYGKISRDVPLSKVLNMLEQTGNLQFKIEGRNIIMEP